MEQRKKKIILGIFIGIGIVAVLVLSFFATTIKENKEFQEKAEDVLTTAQRESEEISEDEQKPFETISVDKYLEIYKQSEASLVLIYKTSCNYCKIAQPILKNLSYRYQLTIYSMNLDDLTTEDKTKLLQSNTYFEGSIATPLLLVVKDGTFVDKVEGLLDRSHYEDFLENYEFIEKQEEK